VKKRKQSKSISGILIGKTSKSSKAKAIAGFFRKCPYCAFCTHDGCTLIATFSLPHHHRWWLSSIQKHPQETVGLDRAEVFFTKYIEVSSPWKSGAVKPRLKKAPCGADCQKCPVYRKKCPGCIATKCYLD
jgi:hypothetical protein